MVYRIIILCIAFILFSCTDNKIKRPPFFGIAIEGELTAGMFNTVKSETGLSPSIIVFFIQWPSIPSREEFPEKSLDMIREKGSIPCITWEPMYYKKGREVMIPQDDIVNGKYDTYIKWFADKIRSREEPVLIRFAHEMNIERYHWGTDRSGYGPQSPAIYKSIYQYVVTEFEKTGCNNVLWVFCPNSESVPNVSFNPTAAWNQAGAYYPGDGYVDILGMDGYNWGTTQTVEKNGWKSNWKSFSETFSGLYKELKTITGEKPVIVFETATSDNGGSKRRWIKTAFKDATEWGLQGLVWFNVKKEIDWRISSYVDSDLFEKIKTDTSSPQAWLMNLSYNAKKSE